MKLLTFLALVIGSLSFTGCATVAEPSIGMTEKRFLLNSVLSTVVYTEGNETVYRSNRLYYTFRDSILVKIDKVWSPPRKAADVSRSTQMSAPVDAYSELKQLDELRKSGIITEEEFQAQKKKILERKE